MKEEQKGLNEKMEIFYKDDEKETIIKTGANKGEGIIIKKGTPIKVYREKETNKFIRGTFTEIYEDTEVTEHREYFTDEDRKKGVNGLMREITLRETDDENTINALIGLPPIIDKTKVFYCINCRKRVRTEIKHLYEKDLCLICYTKETEK